MFQKARETAYLESTSLLVFMIRWRKPLLLVIILTSLASYIFSGPYFIEPKYRSTVIFFPSANNSVSKAILDVNGSDKQDILAFGEEEQAEQMLQILNSDEIRNAIVERYQLMNHYRIDTSKPYPLTRLNEKYKDNITFSRTQYMSVSIDVLDADAEVAASIANDIAALLDSMKTKIQRSRAEAALRIVEQAYEEKKAGMMQKEDSLKHLRQQGIMDYRNQSIIWNEEYAKSYASFSNDVAALGVYEQYKSTADSVIINTKARIKGAESRMKNLSSKLNLLAELGGASINLNEELTLEREELSKLKEQLEKLRIDVNQNISHKFIVNHAVRAEKTCYPQRWLIVVIAVSIAVATCVVVVLFTQRLKEIPHKF